jgi:hypothetical protein
MAFSILSTVESVLHWGFNQIELEREMGLGVEGCDLTIEGGL